MGKGFWSCIILVITFLIIGVLFAIFKERTKIVSGFKCRLLKKNRHCMIKLISLVI